MKKLSLIIVCILAMVAMASFANAEVTFHNANEVTVAWDAVTTDVDGDPVTGTVQYRIYLANADTDPDKTNPIIVLDNITDVSAIITLSVKGRFFIGVQAVLDDLESVINWGDEIENQETVELFGLRFAVPPHAPKNIKR